jgi:hypothetical protein
MMTATGRRTFNKVLGLFLFRTAVFSCVHVVFYFIRQPHRQQKQQISDNNGNEMGWTMADIMALSSCCWLAITFDVGVVEFLRFVWKMRQYGRKPAVNDSNGVAENDEPKRDVKKHRERNMFCSILLIPQTDWYTLKSSVLLTENIEVRVNSQCDGGNNKHDAEFCKNERRNKTAAKLIVTPWTLWYYVYAAGIGLFVLGFSINGLSLLSEASVLLSSVISISFFFRDDTETFPLQYIASWGVCMSVGLVVISSIVNDPHAWGWMFLENMWVAVVLPVMSSIFLCKCSAHVRVMNLTPQKILMFAMPSLAVMSAAFLCFYFPISQQRSFYIELEKLFEHGINGNSSIIFKISKSFGYAQQKDGYNINNNNGSQQQQSEIYVSLFSWANSTQIDGLKNIVNAGGGLDTLVEKGDALSVLSILLAPLMLWVAMVTVIGSTMRGEFNAHSALSSYILVLTVKHFLLNGGGPWNIASLVIVVPSCIMTMLAETWKNSSFYTHYHFDSSGDSRDGDLDDNDDCGVSEAGDSTTARV